MPLMPLPDERNETSRNRRAACLAYDAMRAGRPLKPPPMPRQTDTRSVGARELAREIRSGEYAPSGPRWA